MKNKLPPSHQYIFAKKNARILWTLDENQRIDDYKVYDICYAEREEKLSGLLSRDTCEFSSGNCFSDWDKWILEDCILEIFKWVVLDENILKQIFRELGKIQEFSERLSYFNGNFWDIPR
jgi:hypothetical protein